MKFDSINEEWESLTIPQKNISLLEDSQALQLDKDLILIAGGKPKTFKNSDEYIGINTCFLYNTLKNRFFPFPSLSVPRSSHMIINIGDVIYCLGGRSENNENEGVTSSVERIDISDFKTILKEGVEEIQGELQKKFKWDEVEPFRYPRYSANVLLYKECIYLMCGMGRNRKICKFVEKYNPTMNQWFVLDWKMPFSIYSTTIITFNSSELLLIGGKNEAGMVPSIYQIEIEKKKYFSKGAFSFRVNPKVLNYKDDLYIFGGDKDMSCEKLNPKEFISYAASESYTSFINNDLSTFPAAQTAMHLKESVCHESETEMNYSENDLKISAHTNKLFYTFGTPNHPFILEFNCQHEIVKFSQVSLLLKFYYYGSIFRINNFFAILMGGIIPPHKKASKQTQLIDFRSMVCKKLAKTSIGRCKSLLLGNPEDNKMYIIGGIAFENNNEKHLTSVECLDFKKNKWEKISDLLVPRYNSGGFFLKNKLYVFGGSDGHSFIDTTEIWDLSLNKWQFVENLKLPKPLANFSLNATSYNREEYVFIGGSTKESYSNEILTLKMEESGKFVKSFELKEARSGHKVFNCGNQLILLGGTRSDIGIELFRLDPMEIVEKEFVQFDEALNKYYRDKTLAGVQSC